MSNQMIIHNCKSCGGILQRYDNNNMRCVYCGNIESVSNLKPAKISKQIKFYSCIKCKMQLYLPKHGRQNRCLKCGEPIIRFRDQTLEYNFNKIIPFKASREQIFIKLDKNPRFIHLTPIYLPLIIINGTVNNIQTHNLLCAWGKDFGPKIDLKYIEEDLQVADIKLYKEDDQNIGIEIIDDISLSNLMQREGLRSNDFNMQTILFPVWLLEAPYEGAKLSDKHYKILISDISLTIITDNYNSQYINQIGGIPNKSKAKIGFIEGLSLLIVAPILLFTPAAPLLFLYVIVRLILNRRIFGSNKKEDSINELTLKNWFKSKLYFEPINKSRERYYNFKLGGNLNGKI